MRCTERHEHHDELAEEGFEWCPECGELLDWHPAAETASHESPTAVPIVTGDFPPLTRADLIAAD